MNRIVRLAAPVALALAAFGAQASPSTPAQGGRGTPSETPRAYAVPVPGVGLGEVATGDLFFAPLPAATASHTTPTPGAGRIASQVVVGA